MSLLTSSVPPQTFWDFDPTTIPDCDVWFDAADTSTITAVGTSVKAWASKGSLSIGANIYSGTVTSGNTENGRNYLNFGAASEMRFMCALTAQARSWFIVMRNNTQLVTNTTYTGPINQTVGAGQDSTVISKNGNTTYGWGCGPSGVASTGTFSSVVPNPFGTILVGTIINSATSTSLNEVRVNGTSYALSISSLAASYNTTNLAYRIHTDASPNYVSSDDIFEIIHYNRDLSMIERRAVESYLMWKWGVVRGNEYNFTPTNIPVCLAWYHSDVDFNDATSRATCFTFNTGNSVDTWLDLSGNNRTATFVNASPSTTRPVLTQNQVSGKCAVVFAGASALTNALSLGASQPLTLFAVTAPNQSGFRSVVSINSRPITRGQSLTIYQSSGNLWLFSGGTAATDGNTASTATATNRYDILAFHWNPTLITQMNINGNYLASSTSSPSALRTTGTPVMIIGATCVDATSTFTELWSGGICEIILYDSVLSTANRNRVEKYLSLKWNRPLINAGFLGHPNRFIAPKNRQFNPTDIANCQLWLDATDSLVTSGSSVTSWNDKSGNGNNATATGTVRNTGSINGLTATNWTETANQASGGTPTYLRGSMSNTSNTLTVFSVFSMNSTSSNVARILSLGVVGATDSGNTSYAAALLRLNTDFQAYRNGVSLSTIPFSNISGTPTIACSQFNGTNHTLFINGTARPSVANTGSFNYTAYQIGNSLNEESLVWYNGTIGEVIAYNATLTSAERQKVEGYLAAKWGLRSSLDITHPVYYGPAYTDYINFNPTTLGTIALWLDASDTSTINNGTITDGGNITSLRTKAGSSTVGFGTSSVKWGYYVGTAMNTAVSNVGLPAFNTASTGTTITGNLLPRSTAFTNTTFIVMCSTSTTNVSSPGCVAFANDSGNSSTLTPCTNAGSGATLRARAFNGTTTTDSGTVTPVSFLGRLMIISSTYDSVSGVLNIYRDSTGSTGTVTVTAKPTYGTSLNTVYFVGGSAGFPWQGYVSEVIIYTTVLSDANRNKVETYLAKKWRIGNTSGAAASNIINIYTNPLTIPNSPQIYPTTFADVALWLDATDPDGDGIAPVSGASIRTWVDRSGNSKHAIQTTAANCPFYSTSTGRPAIVFNAAFQYFLNGSSLLTSTAYGVFVVAEFQGTTGVAGTYTAFFDRKVTTANAENFVAIYPFFNNGADRIAMNIYYTNNSSTPTYKIYSTTNPTPTARKIFVISDSSTTTQPYFINGTTATSGNLGSAANVATDAEGYKIGVSNISGGLGNYFTGRIYEVIVMLHQPTTQERLFIEGYLAWKWEIQSSLPTTHPYYEVKT